MTTPNNIAGEEWEKEKIRSEAALFWEEIAKNLPKTHEREALGDAKIFQAFYAAYANFRPFFISRIREEAIAAEREKFRKVMVAYFSKNNLCEHIGAEPEHDANKILSLLTPKQ